MPTTHPLPRALLLSMFVAGCASAPEEQHSSFHEHFPPTLFIAGGALPICSDLGLRHCLEAPPPVTHSRQPTTYRVDAEASTGARWEALWSETPPALRSRIDALIETLERRSPQDASSLSEIESVLFSDCTESTSPDCVNTEAATWSQLDDSERSALLALLEQPQLDAQGERPRERSFPALSRDPGGLAVFSAFVEAARERSAGSAPRIAVVTASALDPFEAVDFYLSTFEALGARVEWWPLDAALAEALAQGDCASLDALRLQRLKLPRREAVYPDLAELQRQACADGDATARLPERVQGVFFAGGDQWRLRQAFFDAQDRPYPWLWRLQRAQREGRLVAGGTSAGAAVQSQAAMLSNGSPEAALRGPGVAGVPPIPGCARSRRCADEDRLSFWPQGGLGLAADAVVDTHFSERAREPRLLRLLAQTGAARGYGVDEASALRLQELDDATQVEAIGREGGWVFLAEGKGEALQARVFSLGTGATLMIEANGSAGLRGELRPCLPGTAIAASAMPTDALQPGATRAAARTLVTCGNDAIELRAGAGRLRLERLAETRVRAGAQAPAIGPLRMRYLPDSQ